MADPIIQAPEEDEIDLKEVFETIRRYKTAIVLFALLFTVGAAVYAYFKPNVYAANASIELKAEKFWGSRATDFMTQAFTGGEANLDNEQLVLKSRFLALKALEYLDIGTRYFTEKNLREVELYKSSPFVVTTFFIDKSAYGVRMRLIPEGGEKFLLKIEPPSPWTVGGVLRMAGILPKKKNNALTYEGHHTFGEMIATPWFKIRVDRLSELRNKEYSFSIVPNREMWRMVKSGVSTSLASKRGSIIIITYEDSVALRAKEVTNALTKAYLQQEIEVKTKEADKTLQFIDQQLAAIDEALKASQGNLEKFKQGNIVVDISEKASMTAEKLSDYESKLQELEIEQSVLSNLQQYIRNNDDISGITLGATGFADAGLIKMISELKQKTIERKMLLTEFTEMHPDVIKLSEVINSLRNSILFTIKSSLSVLQQRKQSLTKIIDNYKASLAALPEQEQKLANLTRTAMVNEKIYSFLLEKRAETAILRSSTVSKTRLIDDAMLPSAPVKPKRSLIVIVGLILGVIVGIAYAFLREFIDNTIKRKEDIERLTHIPLYGVIPTIKGKKFGSAFLEAFRTLRTNLEFMRNDKIYQTIVVTSTVSGEGKTTIAANLAVILAKGGKKVMVVDLDMRRAKLSEYFGLRNTVGISTLLSKKSTLEEVIQHSDKEGVDIIAAGPTPPNPSELIMSDYAQEVMAELKERYDYIILDTPPVGLVTDALILMNRADASLLVVKYGYTKKEFVKGLDKLVQDHHLEHVGIVFNGVDVNKNYGYGYGYGYKYGGSRYYTDG